MHRLGAKRRPMSEAIQSRVRRTMDCFVASAFARRRASADNSAPRKKVGEFHRQNPVLQSGPLTHFHPKRVGALTPVPTRNDDGKPSAVGWVSLLRNPSIHLRGRWVSRSDRIRGRSDRSTHPTMIGFMETVVYCPDFAGPKYFS